MAKIGHFEILELVGRGAMGSVYRAVDPIIGRLVAIKVIRLVGYNDGEEAVFLKERLFKEARAAGSLSHPGIVTVHQLGTQDDQAYIVMEYIDGPTLESRLRSKAPADPALQGRVLLEVAAALDYAHERGVVHRDIKPANIMLTTGGAVKITDFGIAKTLLGHTMTKTGMILGTPFYMSPEQVQGAPIDGRSDQFALAVIAYQMLAGRRPFEGESVTSICYQIVHSEPPSLADLQPDVSPALARILKRALDKDPAKRFPTCTEFARAVVEQLHYRSTIPDTSQQPAAEPAVPLKSRPAPQALPKFRKYRPYLGAALGTVATIGLLAGGTLLFHDRQPPTARTAAAQIGQPPESRPSAVLPDAPLRADAQPEAPVARSAGRIVWTGQARRGALVQIDSSGASSGHLYGRLPGGPIEIRIFPADHSFRHLTVFTSDVKYATPVRSSTAAGPALFSWDPRHMTDLTVWEKPGPANNWQRCALRVNSNQLTAAIIEWRKL